MQHSGFQTAAVVVLIGAALSARTSAQALPPDVRAGHWASTPVQVVLRNHILDVEADKSFHGDTRITHRQAVLALARLGRALEAGTWQGSATIPVTVTQTGVAPKKGAWEAQTVSRYVFATALARMGDYANAGLRRPQTSEKDFGKSIAIPVPVTIKIPKTNPAHDALVYLAARRMVGPGSALLSPDDKPLKAAEMSRALKELVTGLTDSLTDLGHDANGNTHDESFHPNPPAKKN